MGADLTIAVGALTLTARLETVVSWHEPLPALGRLTLWEGAQPIVIERA